MFECGDLVECTETFGSVLKGERFYVFGYFPNRNFIKLAFESNPYKYVRNCPANQLKLVSRRMDIDIESYCIADVDLTRKLMEATTMNGNEIQRGQYIIGSISKASGVVSFSHRPKPHNDIETATEEAKRLAKQFQEKKFIVVEVKCVARTIDVVVE